MEIKNMQEAENYLYNSLPVFHRQGPAAYKADIGNIAALMEYVGNPHLDKNKYIHIAGTNGKGSTAHMTAAYLQTSGFKTGVYTSPHYKDIRERIKVDGQLISEEDFVDCLNSFLGIIEEVQPSFFEIICAMAFLHFKNQNVDFAVIETGMGGRLDSTNIITPILSVITNISFDHQQFLGATLDKIAYEKAGIIKSGIPVIIGEYLDETKSVFIKRATEMDAPIYFSKDLWSVDYVHYNGNSTDYEVKSHDNNYKWPQIKTQLHGKYQRHNLSLFLSIATLLDQMKVISFNQINVEKSLSDLVDLTYFIGRWQRVSDQPAIILESAHNIAGISESVNQLSSMSFKKLTVIFGTVADKDVTPIMSILPQNASYIWTKANIPRAMEEEILKEKANAAGVNGISIKDLNQAIQHAISSSDSEDLILIMGSIFVVGEAYEYLETLTPEK